MAESVKMQPGAVCRTPWQAGKVGVLTNIGTGNGLTTESDKCRHDVTRSPVQEASWRTRLSGLATAVGSVPEGAPKMISEDPFGSTSPSDSSAAIVQ